MGLPLKQKERKNLVLRWGAICNEDDVWGGGRHGGLAMGYQSIQLATAIHGHDSKHRDVGACLFCLCCSPY